MIPQIIHYCWFGRKEKPKLAQKCIASWKRFCPDYQIIEWNEDNFDISQNEYTRMCYEEKRYAFLSDYARLVILQEYGGFYFDTDVELVRPIDALRSHPAFIGFETGNYVNTGEGFGAEPHNPAVAALLAEYALLLDGKHGTKGCPILHTQALLKCGLVQNGSFQDLGGIVVYPSLYFNPYDDSVGKLQLHAETYSIHWYAKSWMNRSTVLRSHLTKPLHRLTRKFGIGRGNDSI